MGEFTTKLQLLEAIMDGITDVQCESTDERRLLLEELTAACADTKMALNDFSDDDTDYMVVALSDSDNSRITCYVETSEARQTIMFAQVADLFLPSEPEISRQDFDAAFAILMSRGDDDG